jgi:hypothetical protein
MELSAVVYAKEATILVGHAMHALCLFTRTILGHDFALTKCILENKNLLFV